MSDPFAPRIVRLDLHFRTAPNNPVQLFVKEDDAVSLIEEYGVIKVTGMCTHVIGHRQGVTRINMPDLVAVNIHEGNAKALAELIEHVI